MTTYYQKAEKKVKSWSLFESPEIKYENAADLFEKAANSYKIEKDWLNAANSFLQVSHCYLKCNQDEMCIRYQYEAANCYRKLANLEQQQNYKSKVVNCLQEAKRLALKCGQFLQAARYTKEIAEYLEYLLKPEENNSDLNNIVDFYLEAATRYDEENSSLAKDCYLKAANHLSSKSLSQYNRARELYELLANKSIDNNSLKWRVKDYLFEAILCFFAMDDLVGAERAFDLYIDKYIIFSDSQERKLLEQLIGVLKDHDVEAYTKALNQYDSIKRLSPKQIQILLMTKQRISEAAAAAAAEDEGVGSLT